MGVVRHRCLDGGRRGSSGGGEVGRSGRKRVRGEDCERKRK